MRANKGNGRYRSGVIYVLRRIMMMKSNQFMDVLTQAAEQTSKKQETYQDRVIDLLERILKKLDGFDFLCEPDMDDEP